MLTAMVWFFSSFLVLFLILVFLAGYLTVDELRAGMQETISDAELQRILADADSDKNGMIDYAEFSFLMNAI